MCKNKLHAQKNPSVFGLCSLLTDYLLMSKDGVVDRINEVRDYFGLGPVINKLRGMED